jgi:hypothetical protein
MCEVLFQQVLPVVLPDVSTICVGRCSPLANVEIPTLIDARDTELQLFARAAPPRDRRDGKHVVRNGGFFPSTPSISARRVANAASDHR